MDYITQIFGKNYYRLQIPCKFIDNISCTFRINNTEQPNTYFIKNNIKPYFDNYKDMTLYWNNNTLLTVIPNSQKDKIRKGIIRNYISVELATIKNDISLFEPYKKNNTLNVSDAKYYNTLIKYAEMLEKINSLNN